MFRPRNRGATKTTAATGANKSGRGSGTHTQNPQLSGKEKHVKTPSKFPPRKVLHPLNSDGGNACGKDARGSKPTPPANELQGIHSALLQQTELLKGLLNRMERIGWKVWRKSLTLVQPVPVPAVHQAEKG